MRNFIRLSIIALISFLYSEGHAQVKKVASIGITVSNIERSVRFYHDVLGFRKISDEEYWGNDYEQLQGLFGIRMHVVRMQLGEETIELTDYLTSGGRSIPEDAMSNDLIFQHVAIVVSDMDKAYQQLRKKMIMQVSTGPQTIPKSNAAAAGVKAFYFHDPDMHNLELIFFPAGKGQPKWQRRTGKLFMGIDHTAIAIRNTDSSLHFYQDLLGIPRKGESWNMGEEQAHLNFVRGASLHITGLRATGGPGIEFLEYLQPGPGKPYPADSRTDDIWHWQTTLVVDDAASLYKKLKEEGVAFVSSGLTRFTSRQGPSYDAFIVRDRDGHAVLIRD